MSSPPSAFVNGIDDPIITTPSIALENNNRLIYTSQNVQNDRPLPVYQPNEGLDHETLASGERSLLNNFTEFGSSVGLTEIFPPNSNNTAQQNVLLPLCLPVDLLNRRLGHSPDESTNDLTQLQKNSNYFSEEMNDNCNPNNRTTTDGTWLGETRGADDVKNILPEVSMD